MAKATERKAKSNKPQSSKPSSKPVPKTAPKAAPKKTTKDEEYVQSMEDERTHWYDEVPPIAEDGEIDETLSLEEQKSIGRQALEKLFEHKNKKQTSDEKWMKVAAASGTTSDKMSASVLLVRSSPLLGLKTLDSLLQQSKKKGDKVNTIAVESLKELFLFDLLPDNRRLKFFREQPWRSKAATNRHLLFWYFEEELKLRYTSFVNTLESCSKNNLPHIRDNSIKAMFDLLSKKPEQEKSLLSLLINKLGDIERKTASKVSFLLLVLLNEHPNMKFIVVREVEIFLNRPHLSDKAKYYAVIFLNQIILLKRDEKVSVKLVEIYFTLFNAILKNESTGNSRMLSALLTGLNRAFPFIPDDSLEKFNDQISVLFKIVHVTTFNKSIQALMLLLQLMLTKKQDISERYYQALYEKLLSPDLHTSSRVAMFFNVLFRSLKVDRNTDRVKSFFKRLLQVCSYEKPSFICASLLIISEVIKMNQSLWSLITKAEKKEEQSPSTVNKKQNEESDDDVSSSNHEDNNNLSQDGSNDQIPLKDVLLPHEYDPYKRNPLYSNATNSTLWELHTLTKHYHPSVRAFAKTLQEKHFIDYKGDPLRDFGIISFLDKFVFKNPKKKESLKGISIMQSYTPTQIKEPILVNSLQFLKQKESNIPVEDLFFYEYFKEKEKRAPRKEKPEKNVDEDEEGDEQGEEEEGGDELDEDEGDIFAGDDAEEDDKHLFADSDSDEGEFSYNDLGDDDFEEDALEDDDEDDENEPSEAMLEKMLLEEVENESDDDIDDEDDEDDGKGKGKKSSFVDADEFATLLQDNTNPKQLEWEKQRLLGLYGKRKRNNQGTQTKPNNNSNNKKFKPNNNKRRKH